MSWFDRLIGRQPDPTADWPQRPGAVPQARFWPFRLGTLRLGDHVDAARFLGRPEEVRRSKTAGAFGLLYTRFGVELEFEQHRLVELTCHVGDAWRASDDVRARALRLADGTRLHGETTLVELRARLGEPRRLDVDDDEGDTELHYEQGGETLEIALGPNGRLERLCVYATDA